jgi:PBP1b-binding outer membrane lipoprotein LpoB
MRATLRLTIALLVPALAMMSGCGDTKVTRESPNSVRDLSGNWNATDSRETAEALINQFLTRSWADDFRTAHNGQKPIVKIGRIVVRSNGDVIATDIFTNDLITALVDSGKARAVASNSETDQAREERKEQDVHASEATRKESFQELGADFLILGAINVQDDQDGGRKQKFYAVDLQLTDIKTQEQVASASKKISKYVER